MIVAFKENDRFYFAYVLVCTNWDGFNVTNLLAKDNLPIKHTKEGFVIGAPELNMPFNILAENTKYLSGGLNPKGMVNDISTIKNILNVYCQIDEDGEMRTNLFIANKDRCYRILEDFRSYEIDSIDIIDPEYGDNSDLLSFIDMEEGSTIKERVVKTFKKITKSQFGTESSILIMNSIDDTIESF